MKKLINISLPLIFSLLIPLKGLAEITTAETDPQLKLPLQQQPKGAFFNPSDDAIKSIAPAPKPASAAKPIPAITEWKVTRDTNLRALLESWSTRAGWTLVWNSEYSYTLHADATFQGDFIAAIKQLFDGLNDLNPALYPELYQGNHVLQVGNKPSR